MRTTYTTLIVYIVQMCRVNPRGRVNPQDLSLMLLLVDKIRLEVYGVLNFIGENATELLEIFNDSEEEVPSYLIQIRSTPTP